MIRVPLDERINNIRSGSISSWETAPIVLKNAGKVPVYTELQDYRNREMAYKLRDHIAIRSVKPVEALTLADLAVLIAEWYTGKDIDCHQDIGIYIAAFCEYLKKMAHTVKQNVPEPISIYLGMKVSCYLDLTDLIEMPDSFKIAVHEYIDTYVNKSTQLQLIFELLYSEVNSHYNRFVDSMGCWTSYWTKHDEPLTRREMKIFGNLACLINMFIIPMAFAAAGE